MLVLHDRQVITVSGPDSEHLLHSVLTANIEKLAPGIACPCALLSPQGKVIFEMMVARTGENAFLLDMAKAGVDDFIKRMVMYKLRADANISIQEQMFTGVSWEGESAASQTDSPACRDARFRADAVFRHYGIELLSTSQRAEWDSLRIDNGIAECPADFALGDVFGHDIGLDQHGGIDFKKGCYIGQEVVSRMHHRGTARKRVLVARADTTLQSDIIDVTAGERVIGKLGTRVGEKALFIGRIDRAKEAMDSGTPIMSGNTLIRLSLPAHVNYDWPTQNADGDDDG